MAIPLSKNSGSGISDWMLKAVSPHAANEEVKNSVQVKSEKDMVEAKSKVEKAASEGKQVFIDKAMTEEQKGEIHEYAQACGMKPSDVIQISEAERKVATSKPEPEKVKKEGNKDPLNAMKSFAPQSSFAKRPMQKVPEAAPKTTDEGRSSGVVGRVGGIEKPDVHRNVGVRPGENSIAAPNNIGQTAESKDKSSRDVIREQNQKRQEKIAFDKKQWEKDVTATLPQGVKAIGGAKLTGAAPSQTHGKVAPGQHSMFASKDENQAMPEKTAGEQLAQKNKEKVAAIQRPKQEDTSWNAVKSSKPPVVSDLLYEGLKKAMGKT